MVTLYELLNVLDLECELEILECDGDLLQEGPRGDTWWEDGLLDRRVRLVVPGIVTKILLDSEV